jgi:hypothetical protein
VAAARVRNFRIEHDVAHRIRQAARHRLVVSQLQDAEQGTVAEVVGVRSPAGSFDLMQDLSELLQVRQHFHVLDAKLRSEALICALRLCNVCAASVERRTQGVGESDER